MRIAWIGLGLGVALAVQTTLAQMVAGTGAPVDLVLVVVVVVAIATGPLSGLWTGTVGGLLQDALSGGVIGVGALAKTVVGYLVGQFGAQFMVTRPAHQIPVFFVGSLVHAAFFISVYALLFEGDTIVSTYHDLLIQAATNTVIGGGAAIGLQVVPGAIERRQLRRRWPSRRPGD